MRGHAGSESNFTKKAPPKFSNYGLAAVCLCFVAIAVVSLDALAQTITINSVTSHTSNPAWVGSATSTLTRCDFSNSTQITVNFDFSGFTNESHTITLQIDTVTQVVVNVSGSSGTGIERDFTSDICSLAEAQYDFAVTLSDSVFGDQTQTALDAVQTDFTDPAAPSMPDMAAGSDSGALSTDNITNNQSPQFTGTAEDNSTVTLVSDVNGTLTPTGTATAGNYDITISSVLTGSFTGTGHNITATATDAAGNRSLASGALLVTIDTGIDPPSTPDLDAASDSGASNSDDLTNDVTPIFTGTAEAASTIEIVSSIDLVVGSGTAAGGSYSITTSPLTGDFNGEMHLISATAEDAAGNTNSSGSLSVTIDTGVNTPSTPDLASGSDSGTSDTDNITNDTTPTFTGTTDTDSTVTIASSVNGSVGSGSGATGSYSITTSALTGSFAGTSHNITASVTDTAGNSSSASSALSVTIDTGVNAPSVPDLHSSTDSGSSSSDNITNVTSPRFTGTAEANSTVTLTSSVDGTLTPNGTATGGNYDITLTSVLTGSFAGTSHNITASATDTAGNSSSASSALSVTIDTGVNTPSTPDLASGSDSGSSDTDNITYDTTPTFTGTTDTDSTVTISSSVNGSVGSGSGATGSYSITTSALTGSFAGTNHNITASATDTAGNSSSASSALSVTIDTGVNAPSTPDLHSSTDSGSSSSDNITNVTSPRFTGTAEANSTVTLTSSVDGTLTPNGTATGGNYDITLTSVLTGSILGTSHTITAAAVDVAGNSSSSSGALTITVDNGINAPSTPDLHASSDSGSSSTDNITNDQTPRFTGTSESNSVVTLFSSIDGTLVPTGTATGGSYNITVTTALTASTLGTSHSITAQGVDVAGNISALSGGLTIIEDNFVDPPSVPDLDPASDSGVSNSDNITNDTTPTFTGTSEVGSAVVINSSVNGNVGTGTATGGSYNITTSTLTGGSNTGHNIKARATDIAGNISLFSSALSIIIDTVAPDNFAETIGTPKYLGGGIQYVKSTTQVSVDADDSGGAGTGIQSCQIRIDSGGFANYGTISGGALNGDLFQLPTPDGPHSFDVTCADVPGNTSSTFSRTRTVDDTPPDIDDPRHQNTSCYPTANCSASQDVVANTYVKSLSQSSVTPSYPSVPASTFDYPSFSDPMAGVNPGSGVDSCTLTGSQSIGIYSAGTDFMMAIGDGAKTFNLSCDDNLGNNSVNTSPSLNVDDTPPVIPNNLSHDNATCYPFSACISSSEIVAAGTYIKAQDKAPFTPQNTLLPPYLQFIPKSTFQWEQTDTNGTIDDPVTGSVNSGLRDCVLTGGTTQDNTIYNPPFADIFNSTTGDGARTFRDNCRDHLGNQAFTDANTIQVDDTPPTTTFSTSGPLYIDPSDGVIFIESVTQIFPTLSDSGVGVDLPGIGGPPANLGPTNPACLQNLDEDAGLTMPCTTAFSFPPPDQDHHLWIMRPDLLGNVTETQFDFVVDDTFPQIKLTTPAEGDVYLLNEVVMANWEVTDNIGFFNDVQEAPFAPGLDKRGSGIQTVIGTTADGQPLDTDDLGVHSFTIVVTDNLDHTTALTVSYRVTLDFDLDDALETALQKGQFGAGDVVTLKFALNDANGVPATRMSPKIGLIGPDGKAKDLGSDVIADYDGSIGRYVFPINTAGYAPGRYKIVIEIGDGNIIEIEFDLSS